MSREKVVQFAARLQAKASVREAAKEADFTDAELDRLIEAMTIVLDRRQDILAPNGGIDTDKLELVRQVIQPLERKLNLLADALELLNETQRMIGESIGSIYNILDRANIRSVDLRPTFTGTH